MHQEVYTDILKGVNRIMELMTSWEKKGLEKGLKKWLEKGRTEEKVKIAKQMLEKEFPLKVICEFTGLSEAEVEKLKD
ncbi:transposase [Alkalihalobacterium alkalinitrilicum]|uniref:transposase n=1 Tax=Alkalihalobacterium alkalinitrilicum TaxID=427920 RepID=UPI001C5644A0|nr:transposase [Alkalihalobacterium alkalinitrilicum]